MSTCRLVKTVYNVGGRYIRDIFEISCRHVDIRKIYKDSETSKPLGSQF